MGATPIPCIPPSGEYLPDGNGGLIDVSGYVDHGYSAFRQDITSKPEPWAEVLNLATVLAVLALLILPLLWWLYG